MSEKEKVKISTFSKVMTQEEADSEKLSGTPTGKALKDADRRYRDR